LNELSDNNREESKKTIVAENQDKNEGEKL
jgi:hypothetical protein